MLTQKVQDNLTKLIGIVNNCDDTMTCRVVIINNDTTWKKSIKDAICNDNTLFPCKHYNVTFERFINDECVKTEFSGCISLQVEKMLQSMDNLECMIITISNIINVYNREKRIFEKPKFVYIVA